MEFNREYSRRDFIVLSELFAAGLLTSCGNQTTPPGMVLFDRAVDEIRNPITKKYILDDIRPLYATPGLRMVDFDGVQVRVEPASIQLRTIENVGDVYGEYIPRSGPISLGYRVQYPQERYFPYPGTLKPEEIAKTYSLGGYGFIKLKLDQMSGMLFPGLRPQLTLSSPDINRVKGSDRIAHNDAENFVMIKEICTHLINNFQIKEIVRILKETGQPTTIDVMGRGGVATAVEYITLGVDQLLDLRSRSLAALDLGGLILALNSVSGSRFLDLVPNSVTDPNFNINPFVQEVTQENLGTTERDIHTNVMNIVLNRPEAKKLYHAGNMDILP